MCVLQLGNLKTMIQQEKVTQQGARNAVLVWALQTVKLDQHVRLALCQGTAGLWLLLRESPVLLLNTQAKPTSDQQARACACTYASSERDKNVMAAKQPQVA